MNWVSKSERNADTRYLAAKLARDAGDVYVALWVYDSTFDTRRFLPWSK